MRFIVAVDIHQAGASQIVDRASAWAAQMGATLDLAFVDEYEYSAYLIRDAHVRDLVVAQWDRVQQSHRSALLELAGRVPAEARGEARYLQGRAQEKLLEICADYDALLVATHGRTGLSHFFLGSVAERLVRFAPIPVVVLRLPQAAEDQPHVPH
ncbi:MAG: universal stress protein [Myxococcales bacterium]|nr:universal stress protein [Myxococcales bacterium]